MKSIYINILKISIIVFFCFFSTFINAQNEDIIKQVNYNFDKDFKKTTPDKSNYSYANANGKLIISQKGKSLDYYNPEIFTMSDFNKYYDIDERFELKFIESNPESAFGLYAVTYDGKGISGYYNITQFMLTADGKLKYYSGPVIEDKDFIKLTSEPCEAFKIGEVNKIAFVRKSHDWFLMVNGQEVKHSVEDQMEPILHIYTGRFIFSGKCNAEIDNFSFTVLHNKEKKKILEDKLRGLTGVYGIYASCLKNDKHRKISLEQIGNTNKFNLGGIVPGNPIGVYIDESQENVFTVDDFYVKDLGNVSKFKIELDKEKNVYNVIFKVIGAGYICEFEADN